MTSPSHKIQAINRCLCLAELLELWPQSQRDLQRLQYRTILRFFLPAQGLGAAPPPLWPEPAWPESPQPEPATDSWREGLLSQVCRLQCAKSSPGQDLGNHLTLLNTCLCDSHRHQWTLSPRLTCPRRPHSMTKHSTGGSLFEPVRVAVGSSAGSKVEAGRMQAQQTLLHGLWTSAPVSRLSPEERVCHPLCTQAAS